VGICFEQSVKLRVLHIMALTLGLFTLVMGAIIGGRGSTGSDILRVFGGMFMGVSRVTLMTSVVAYGEINKSARGALIGAVTLGLSWLILGETEVGWVVT